MISFWLERNPNVQFDETFLTHLSRDFLKKRKKFVNFSLLWAVCRPHEGSERRSLLTIPQTTDCLYTEIGIKIKRARGNVVLGGMELILDGLLKQLR